MITSHENKEFHKTSQCQDYTCQGVVFLVLTINMYTQKTWDKQHIYPLGKTTVKAYENKVLNGSFLNAGKLLVNV